jgi:hypothetical protein
METGKAIGFFFYPEEAKIIRRALGKQPHDEVQDIILKMYQTVENNVFGKDDLLPVEKMPRKAKEAPWGYKKDGTPKKRPGRKA